MMRGLHTWLRGARATASARAGDEGGDPAAEGPLLARRWAERRPVVLTAAALLFACVFVVRQVSGDTGDGLALLYVAPIALVALELGLVAGLAAAALAVGLVVVWAVTTDADVGVIGIATRAAAYIAVGGLAGRFSDRMRDAHRRERDLLRSGLALAHLTARDDLAATLAGHARALAAATGVRVQLNGREPAMLGALDGVRDDVSIELRGVRHGTLTVATPRRLAPEDRLSLTALALQAAVAHESQRLLEIERDRAEMRAELREVRRSLDARSAQLRGLITGQEAERRHVSHELHEEAAQSLAAVLLGLGALERELGAQLAPAHVGMLRTHVDGTLRALRSLAVSLRPPSLEQLGLKAALEQLASDPRHGESVRIDVVLPAPSGLDGEIETTVYRVAEEALNAADGTARSLTVFLHPERREIAILLETGDVPIDEDRLAALAGRLDLAGGTLQTTPDGVEASVPLPPPRGRFERRR